MSWFRILLIVLALLCGSGYVDSAYAADETPAETSSDEAAPSAEETEAGGNALMNLLFPKEFDPELPPLQPNLTLFLFTLILFVTFVFFMRTTTWQPLIKGLDAREARVVQAEKDAEAARAEAKRLQVETEAKLAAVQEQVRDIVAEARKKAETEKQKIVSDAQAEAERVKQEALAEITSARESALSELSAQVDAQVAAATEHVVGRVL